MDYQGEGEREDEGDMHWLVGGKENAWLLCVEMDMSGQAKQGHGKGLGRKHLRQCREVGRLADGEVIGVIGRKDKQAGSAQYHDIQDDRVWLGRQVGRDK